MPTDTEGYRRVMRKEAHAWLAMASRFKSKAWLQGLTPDSFSSFVAYVLGERVHNLVIDTGVGEVGPAWALVLAYELKLRREAFKLVNAQTHTLHEALQHVIKSSEIKEIHFTTPLAIMSASRSRGADGGGPSKYQRRESKGGPKGGGKGDKKGKTKGKFGNGGKGNVLGKIPAGLDLVDVLPDGRQLCWNFNNGNTCPGQCGRVHQCRVAGCFGAHAARRHWKYVKKQPAGAPTAPPAE